MAATTPSSLAGRTVPSGQRRKGSRPKTGGRAARKAGERRRQGRDEAVWNGAKRGPVRRAADKAGRSLKNDLPGPPKAPEAGALGVKRPTEAQLQAVGLTPETAAELRAWIAAQQQTATGRRPRPEACNHEVLAFMQQVVVVLGLRPAEVEARTGMQHQHQHRLKPTRDGLGESHVSLCTVLRWTNGLGLCLPRVLDRLLQRLPTLMVLWEGMAA